MPHALLLALSCFALPQHATDVDGAGARRASAVPRVLVGRVLGPLGRPAPDVLVTTSAGGRALTGADGAFEIRVEVPDGASRVEVIARRDRRDGRTLGASTSVVPTTPATTTSVGLLVLSPWDGCSNRWLPTFGGAVSLDPTPTCLATFDDGTGPALYIGGITSAGGETVPGGIVRWDGASWSDVGGGTNGTVHAMTVWDDGGGPALFVAGEFTTAGGVGASSIARWDGTSWAPLGLGLTGPFPVVEALAVFDDGTGPALHAGGNFGVAGGQLVGLIARWDGTSWSPLGLGVNAWVRALTVWDDGGGPALWVAGDFTSAGGAPANRLARWDGASWFAPTSQLTQSVHALAAFDDGTGEALYLGGAFFETLGGNGYDHVARWDGASMAAVGGGASHTVRALLVHDDGSGPRLFAAGDFTRVGGGVIRGISAWDGAQWSEVGGWPTSGRALGVLDEGDGPALFLSGTETSGFFGSSGRFFGLARWNGAEWTPVVADETLRDGPNSHVVTTVVVEEPGGPALYVGGAFTRVGEVESPRVARWDGESWSGLGAGLNEVPFDFARFVGPSGPRLYAAHAYDGPENSTVSAWNGSSWQPIAPGSIGFGYALVVFDDGSGEALYLGGNYVSLADVQRWNGTTWSPVGATGTFGSANVLDLAVFDDGTGPRLHAGGDFALGNGIAAWNGSTWVPVGGGLGGTAPFVTALLTYDDGGGPALYAAGEFTSAGGVPANRVARWDGVAWTALDDGSGTNGFDADVEGLTVFDDGDGPLLCAVGNFSTAGGLAAPRLAGWNGSSWTALQGASFHLPRTIAGFQDRNGPALYLGGLFRSSLARDQYIAKRGCGSRLLRR